MDEAEQLFRDSLALRRRTLGQKHVRVGYSLSDLGGVLREKGNLAAAESLYREALDLFNKTLPEGHADLAQPLIGLAEVLAAKGDNKQAEGLLREAVTLRTRTLPEGHIQIAVAKGASDGPSLYNGGTTRRRRSCLKAIEA